LKVGLPKNWLWSGVSASTDGVGATVWGLHTRKEAYQTTLRNCKERSQQPARCLAMTATNKGGKQDGGAVILLCKRKKEPGSTSQLFANGTDSRINAEKYAYYAAIQAGWWYGHCKVIASVTVKQDHN